MRKLQNMLRPIIDKEKYISRIVKNCNYTNSKLNSFKINKVTEK